MDFAPIVLFTYNRPDHTKRTLEALSLNKFADKSILYIYCDGAKGNGDEAKVEEVKKIVANQISFKEVIYEFSDVNRGLANSVIKGVSTIVKKFGKVIVLEDDLVTSKNFLEFMNEALDFYQNEESIYSISGYCQPIKFPASYRKDVFLTKRAYSWGWATWEDRWEKNDWEVKDFNDFISNSSQKQRFAEGGADLPVMLKKQQLGLVDSWAIRWCFTQFRNGGYGLSPVHSFVENIGHDKSGTHSGNTNRYEVDLFVGKIKLSKDLVPNDEIIEALKKFHKLSLVRRIINYLKFGI
ncbi:MAG: sugar transferase [Salibacteraceae bacterium]